MYKIRLYQKVEVLIRYKPVAYDDICLCYIHTVFICFIVCCFHLALLIITSYCIMILDIYTHLISVLLFLKYYLSNIWIGFHEKVQAICKCHKVISMQGSFIWLPRELLTTMAPPYYILGVAAWEKVKKHLLLCVIK